MNKLTVRLLAASALCAVGTVAMTMPATARDGDVSVSISVGSAAFGYDDGYYDNDRRWHDWQNDEERNWYRENHRQTYYQMGRYDDRDQYRRDWLGGRRNDWRVDNGDDFSVSLGNVVFAYNDGYYDSGRRWHDWRSDRERDWYRQNHRQTYYLMGRSDDRDNYRRDWLGGRRDDWRGDNRDDFSVSLGNVVFAYNDGYYDSGRRWHDWRNDREREWYRQNHRQTYYLMGRYDDRDNYRRDWASGRRDDWRNGRSDVDFTVLLGNIVFAYDDGYYDNNRRWHNWRNVDERNWYMQNHGKTYYHMRRHRDRDHNRRDWREGRSDDWRS